MKRCGGLLAFAIGVVAAACAPTLGPVTSSVQVLVLLDSLDDTLRIIPVDSPEVVHHIVLAPTQPKHALAVKGQIAAISIGRSAFTINLIGPQTLCPDVVDDPTNPIGALGFNDDGSLLFATIAGTNRVSTVAPAFCGTNFASGRGQSTAMVSARSTLFFVAGSGALCLPAPAECPELPSWLIPSTTLSVDPSVPLSLGDSIPLSLPGNAHGAVLASDGLIYVINSGNGRQANARLSQVSPVSKSELSVIAGFGTMPQYIATDGDRVFVASATEGLMVYDTRTKQVTRDANSAIPLSGAPRGLAADDLGRVYALIAGSCTPTGASGSIRVFGADLVPKHGITVGRCPVAIAVTDIPSTLYHFDN